MNCQSYLLSRKKNSSHDKQNCLFGCTDRLRLVLAHWLTRTGELKDNERRGTSQLTRHSGSRNKKKELNIEFKKIHLFNTFIFIGNKLL